MARCNKSRSQIPSQLDVGTDDEMLPDENVLVVNGGIRHLARSANFNVRPYDGCLPAVCVAAYQLRRSIRFISGSPVRLAVATSEVIFPNNCGFLKSTVEFGAEKPKLWNGFWKS